MYRTNVLLGRAMASALRPLQYARDVLADRVCGDEAGVRCEAAASWQLSLQHGRCGAKRRFDSERAVSLDVLSNELFALLRDGSAHVTRNGRIRQHIGGQFVRREFTVGIDEPEALESGTSTRDAG